VVVLGLDLDLELLVLSMYGTAPGVASIETAASLGSLYTAAIFASVYALVYAFVAGAGGSGALPTE